MKTVLHFVLAIAWAASARGDVKLPAVFSDHMVLQSGAAAAVWGWAEPGEGVTVSIAGQAKTTQAGADGKWMVKLDALKPLAEPQVLTVKGKNTLTVQDVLLGEVWLASGQSNMEMQLTRVDRAEEEQAAAHYPRIRMFIYNHPLNIYELATPPRKPQSDGEGQWWVCTPETAGRFSAIGYFFARELHQQLRVPIGILNASVGGTPIEAWTSLTAQQAEPALQPVLDNWEARLSSYDPQREQAEFLTLKKHWLKQRAAAIAKGEPVPKAPLPFKNLRVMEPAGLFNGVIAPLAPYTLRGLIWYQGERNALGPLTGYYGLQLATLIRDWRTRWGDEFYVAWVQLPRFQKEQRAPVEPNGWGVSVRDAMRKTLSVPRTGMAVTIDLGGATEGHPTNKLEFARRLSLLALHDVYGQPIETWSGPIFRSAERDGDKMVIAFQHATGLKSSSGKLAGFAIAGADQQFVWAQAEIAGERVMVWSDAVKEPAAVRYCWAANPSGNLVNAAGLPASPFRTDDWK